jgi:hypothetical protein
MLDHIGVPAEPPCISPARGPPLREDCDAQAGEAAPIEPDWDLEAQPAPDYEVESRFAFSGLTAATAAAQTCAISGAFAH